MDPILQRTIVSQFCENYVNTSENLNLQLLTKLLKKRRRRTLAILMLKEKKLKNKIPKISMFFKRIQEYPDHIFYNHFRMSRNTFEKLYKMLEPSWDLQWRGRPAYGLDKCLYITLWKLSNINSFRGISRRFGVAVGSAYRVFTKIIQMLSALKERIVIFPSTESSQNKIMDGFQHNRSQSFPNVLGCIDGIDIKISAPSVGAINYYDNRKGFHSILVQGVVDTKMRFLDVFIGYPGRSHNTLVWNNSPLREAIVSKSIRFPPECHLLGDATYPLEPHLLVPYRDDGFLTTEQKKFNQSLSSTRVCVKQAFDILKKRFRILDIVNLRQIQLVKHIIMACIVLHNIIINNEDVTGYTDLEQIKVEQAEIATDDTPENSQQDSAAIAKRERIKLLLRA